MALFFRCKKKGRECKKTESVRVKVWSGLMVRRLRKMGDDFELGHYISCKRNVSCLALGHGIRRRPTT